MATKHVQGRALMGRVTVLIAALWGAVVGAAYSGVNALQTNNEVMAQIFFRSDLVFAIPTGMFVGGVSMVLGILVGRCARRVATKSWVVSSMCAVTVLVASVSLILLILKNDLFSPGPLIWVPIIGSAIGSLTLCFVRVGAHVPWTWGGR